LVEVRFEKLGVLGSSSGVVTTTAAASAATTAATTTATVTITFLSISCQVNSKTDLGRDGCCHNKCLGDHHFEISFVFFFLKWQAKFSPFIHFALRNFLQVFARTSVIIYNQQ